MIDQLIDGMAVEGVIGNGAMAILLKARLPNGAAVALKLLLPKHMSNPEIAERFVCEGQALGALDSPYLPRVLATGTTDSDQPYIVMELLEGLDLETLLANEGRPTPSNAARYVAEACEAVAVAHDAGIVHRDVKPGNLFLARSEAGETIKLLDFGIAKLDRRFEKRRHTSMRLVMGTSHYMSPEQIRSSTSVTFASDIWSLGVVLFELVTGRVPFEEPTALGTLNAILNVPVPEITAIGGDAPEALTAIFARCLAKAPAARFGSAREMATALRSLAPELAGGGPFFVPAARAQSYPVPLATVEIPRSATFAKAATEVPLPPLEEDPWFTAIAAGRRRFD